MAFQLGDEDTQSINEMNLIPLIDIMLVLMIIFLVTATVLNPTVPLELPKTSAEINDITDKPLQISIDKQGNIFWDTEVINLTILKQRFSEQKDNPSIQLRADKDARYDTVAKVLAVANETGLNKIAFVNE